MSTRADYHDHEKTSGRPLGIAWQSPHQGDLGGEKREGDRFNPQQKLGDRRRVARRLVDFSTNHHRSSTHTTVGGEQSVLAATN